MENQIKCKPLKKTKDPKCNDQPHCNWVKGEGCIPKIQVRTPVEIVNLNPPVESEPVLQVREEKLDGNKPEKQTIATKQQKSKELKIKQENNLEKAMDVFYKTKHTYEEGVKSKKAKIYANFNLTKKEKKQKIRELVPKCLNCKKPGGMVFSEKNRTLKAVCSAEEPCNFNIEIKLGTYVQKETIIEALQKRIMFLKETIIITKLNILFRLEKEDVMVSEFNELKKEYETQEKQLLNLYRYIEDKLNIANKKVVLNNAKLQLQKEIEDFKGLLKEAKREKQQNNSAKSKTLLKEAVEKYINDIQTLQENIRNVEYGYLFIENSEEFNVDLFNEFRLYKENYTLEDNEVEQDSNELITFRK